MIPDVLHNVHGDMNDHDVAGFDDDNDDDGEQRQSQLVVAKLVTEITGRSHAIMRPVQSSFLYHHHCYWVPEGFQLSRGSAVGGSSFSVPWNQDHVVFSAFGRI